MASKYQIRDRRQAQYVHRAKSARMYGRFLIPVAMLVAAQAVWSDPDLGPLVIESAEKTKPYLATFAAGTPLDGMFGPVPEQPSVNELVSLTSIESGEAGAGTGEQPEG